MNKQVLLDKLSEFLMVEQCGWQLYRVVKQLSNGKTKTAIEAAVAEVGPEEDEHLRWAQTELAELSLEAITQEPPPDPNGSAGSSSNPIWRSSRSMPPRPTSGGSPMRRSCPPRSRHQPRERRRRPARSVLLG